MARADHGELSDRVTLPTYSVYFKLIVNAIPVRLCAARWCAHPSHRSACISRRLHPKHVFCHALPGVSVQLDYALPGCVSKWELPAQDDPHEGPDNPRLSITFFFSLQVWKALLPSDGPALVLLHLDAEVVPVPDVLGVGCWTDDGGQFIIADSKKKKGSL